MVNQSDRQLPMMLETIGRKQDNRGVPRWAGVRRRQPVLDGVRARRAFDYVQHQGQPACGKSASAADGAVGPAYLLTRRRSRQRLRWLNSARRTRDGHRR